MHVDEQGQFVIPIAEYTDEVRKRMKRKPIVDARYGNIGTANKTFTTAFVSKDKQHVRLPLAYGLAHPTWSSSASIENRRYPGDDKAGDCFQFNGTLKVHQSAAVDAVMQAHDSGTPGGILSLYTGAGKTVLALYILSVLKKKALIVVHKQFLADQWESRIATFLPNAKVGRVQQKQCDVGPEFDISIAMIQSMSQKDYPLDTWRSFGVMILDECHHVNSETFCLVMSKNVSSFNIGLSATPKRLDGLECVFEDYIGPILFTMESVQLENVHVDVIHYKHPRYATEPMPMTKAGEINMAGVINFVLSLPERDDVVVQKLRECLVHQRHILVLTDRRTHVDTLVERLVTVEGISAGKYYGGMKQEALTESERCSVIVGTFHIASEGLDIPSLDTVFMISSRSNVKQCIGRAMRRRNANHVLIVDMVDAYGPLGHMFWKRNKLYKDFCVQHYDYDHQAAPFFKARSSDSKKVTLQFSQ